MNHSVTEQFDRDCEDALGWIARFRSGDASEQDRESFALWLAEAPARKLAMDSMLDMYGDLGALAKLESPAAALPPAANDRSWFAAGAAALAACLVLAITLWPGAQPQVSERLLQTAFGERKTFRLEDNSIVVLNTNSRAEVSYSDSARYIELIRGEAQFTVTPDAERPFSVDAGSARSTAVGTAFNIRRDAERSTVTVTEGVVRVSELGAAAGKQAGESTLRINEQVISDSNGLSNVKVASTEAITAWQRGELLAREMPLVELTRELERYTGKTIQLGNSELAALTVSGVFRSDQPDALLAAVATTLQLEIVPLGVNTLQLRPARL